MADMIVIAILASLGFWAVRSLRTRGSGCCGKGGSCACSGCSKACPSKIK